MYFDTPKKIPKAEDKTVFYLAFVLDNNVNIDEVTITQFSRNVSFKCFYFYDLSIQAGSAVSLNFRFVTL